MKKSKITFDVMLEDKYVCEIVISYCPLFPIEEADITKEIIRRRPTLRNKLDKVRVAPTF